MPAERAQAPLLRAKHVYREIGILTQKRTRRLTGNEQ